MATAALANWGLTFCILFWVAKLNHIISSIVALFIAKVEGGCLGLRDVATGSTNDDAEEQGEGEEDIFHERLNIL